MDLPFLKRLFSTRSRAKEVRYVQHPRSMDLGSIVVPTEGQMTPQALNDVGVFIWKQLKEPRTAAEVVAALVHEFDVSRSRAAKDLRVFLEDLVGQGLVVPASSAPTAAAEPASRGYKFLASALYQPDSILRDRVAVDALSGFLKAVEGVCQAYFDDVVRPELLDIAIAQAKTGDEQATQKTIRKALQLAEKIEQPNN